MNFDKVDFYTTRDICIGDPKVEIINE